MIQTQFSKAYYTYAPMVHGKIPDSARNKCDLRSRTALARFTSGHRRCIYFDKGREIHLTFKNCSGHPFLSDHILDCFGLSNRDLEPDLFQS
ncbi:hypothetical protein TNCV_3854061 [Trichonephila clavipes]|nr:hypothetical protein TNCV_3854061 [Trichonephila clavipes]